MASTSTDPIPHKYDVFLSFRGEDTRHSFTDHLYKALCQAGISTFRDDDEIRKGHELKPEIEESIRDSRASVIVFSKTFATSRWCLDELWLILEQRRKGIHFVLPVFYGVDPSDIRNQRGSFKIKAKYGFKRSKWTKENVKRWKAALTEVADLKGIPVSRSETACIADVIQKLYCELDLKLLSIPTNLAGIESRAEGINTWLKNVQPRSPVLAICGMGGIGKTTLAKYIYNSNKQNFECSSFLEDIENKSGVLLGLQKQLLRDVLGNNIMIFNVSEGTSHIEKAIQRKRALIVVDDIDDVDQLSPLFGTKVLHTQSKIIITTRLLNIDRWVESISYGCHVNKVEFLNDHESLEVLSYHAFRSKIPMKGFEELALQLAQYCEGNPLALNVLGSSLHGERIGEWSSTVNLLNSFRGDLDHKIQGVLQKSFDTLPCDSHKELFLHIACLFFGERVDVVQTILENDYPAASGILTLTNRCLITFSRDGRRLTIHKLLRDMAGNIVRNQSNDPAEHSRVWRRDECCSLLRRGDGSRKIEGLVMYEQGISETFETSSFVKMKNLKYLQLDYVKLTGSYKNFPDLRWLRWNGCNMKTIPEGLLMSSLVAVDMRGTDLEEFDPPTVLNSLKILNLSASKKLVSICNLHRLPILESLELDFCTSLTHVCKTIGDLEKLSYLSLLGCTKLWKASSNQMFVNQEERLKDLCSSGGIPEQPLFSLPQSLSKLLLSGNPFEFLPSYIGLQMLLSLELTSCPNLKSLPCLPSTLQRLYVRWCSSLENITFQSARFTLQDFRYEGCFKLCEIQGLFKLVSIERLDVADLGNMQWIKAYQKNHKVDLVGDVITKGRAFNIQMLYEYGIKSTYLQGIKDQSMATHQYTSSSWFLSFRVPLHPKKRRIQGLNVTIIYRSSSGEDRDTWPPLFTKISNRTKDVTWVYNPVVYCKPLVDKEVVWLSYWPIGNSLDAGDEVHVSVYVKTGTITTGGYGASVVYMEDGEVEKEEKSEERMKKEEEVIGGDLSRLEVTKGGFYLCRRDYYNSWVRGCFFGQRIQIPADSSRWRRFDQRGNYEELNSFRNPKRDKFEVTLGVSFNSESETDKIEKAVSSVDGVESVFINKAKQRLIVRGCFDFQAVVTCVREYEKIVQVLSYVRV